MKFKVYVAQNIQTNCFERPIFTNLDPDDFVEAIQRDFACSSQEAKERLVQNKMFFIGTYDDKVCAFDLLADKKLVIDISQLGHNKPVPEISEVTDNA